MSNATQVLDEILKAQKSKTAPKMPDDEFFELFVSEQALRAYRLENADIESGIVRGGGDGGIDSVYLFVNGRIISGDVSSDDFEDYKKNIVIDWIVIQSTRQESFKEERIRKIHDTLTDALNLTTSPEKLMQTYNAELVAAIERFRETRRALATSFPTLNVEIFYASKGDSSTADPKVLARQSRLKEFVTGALPTDTTCRVTLLGAREILELASKAPRTDRKLSFGHLLLAGGGGYICLVSLPNYYQFITENNELLYHLFESNVRDYNPDVDVNKEIRDALNKPSGEDFWSLNNGITVIAEKVGADSESLTISEPQIVNGLQTSQEIFNYFHGEPGRSDNRRVMVRVITSKSPESQDRIIKATNRQTGISAAQLHATEQIHRDIERIFPASGLFYDRRQNYWQNRNKPKDQLVGIQELTQALIAIYLQRPDTARARPSAAFSKKSAQIYQKLFAEGTPLKLYVFCAQLQKTVELLLRESTVERGKRNDLRFYVSMSAAVLLTQKVSPSADELANAQIALAPVGQAGAIAQQYYYELGGTEQVAKGSELLAKIKAALTTELNSSFSGKLPFVESTFQ